MIGAGRMGANMSRRLAVDGHDVIVHDVSPQALSVVAEEGFETHTDLADFVGALSTPRAHWMMIPAAYVQATIEKVAPLLEADDVLIDGGNSWYRDDIDRAELLGSSGARYLDCGTSGSVAGLERGYCLMIGGDAGAVARLDSVSQLWRRGWRPPSVQQGAVAIPAPRRTATCTAAHRGLVTLSRWFTTASSTASWPHTPRD